jgi:hypothetical protein
MHPSALRKDGRAFEVTRVLVEPDYLHPDYDLDQTPRRITPTGRLTVLEILPRLAGRLGFSGRWDERAGSLDIDPPEDWSRTVQAKFRNGWGGYGGHHPVLLPDRRFDVHIRVPGLTVFRGVVSFGLGRELEVPSGAIGLTGYSPGGQDHHAADR